MSPNADVFELLRTMNQETGPPPKPKPVVPQTLLSKLIQRKIFLVILAIIVYFLFASNNEFLIGSNVFVALLGWEVVEYFLNGRSFRSGDGGSGGGYLNILFMLGGVPPQTSKFVLLKKALPGIIAATVLAISRAFGETIAVLMVCGNVPLIPQSIFEAGYPLPALIANNYGEMMSIPLYDSALLFAALLLFVIIFIFNAVSRIILARLEKNLA